MVGLSLSPGYRADLNFLSKHDYTRSPARYIRLTADEAKPALPFASGYRLVDFVLSNLVNSHISTIYVLAQYKPESLIKHVTTAWSPWFGDGKDSQAPRSRPAAQVARALASRE